MNDEDDNEMKVIMIRSSAMRKVRQPKCKQPKLEKPQRQLMLFRLCAQIYSTISSNSSPTTMLAHVQLLKNWF